MDDSILDNYKRVEATIMVLARDTDRGLESYLVKRGSDRDLLPGHYVHPGGKKDPEDKDHIECVIRETFEEVGINVKRENILYFKEDEMVHPEVESIYHVVTYIAPMPSGQKFNIDLTELDSGLWVIADDALSKHKEGKMPLTQMTVTNLEKLSQYNSLDEIFKKTN